MMYEGLVFYVGMRFQYVLCIGRNTKSSVAFTYSACRYA